MPCAPAATGLPRSSSAPRLIAVTRSRGGKSRGSCSVYGRLASWSGPSERSTMIQTVALLVTAGYGILSLAGGVIGFVKAGSRASLIAGGASGVLLIGSALLGASQPVA